MKWILFLLALLSLLAVFIFLPGKSTVQELDPNKPWLAQEPVPESSEAKEASADDPRSLENRMLQKDFCASSSYFRFGRRNNELNDFLKKIWPQKEDEKRDLGSATYSILSAQFANSRDEAIAKLRLQQGAEQKLLLGAYQAGLTGFFQGVPTEQELHEALISFDEAEDLYPTNSLVPIYRAMLMQKTGAKPEGIAAFLKEELPKRELFDSPLSAARLDYLNVVSRDSLLFAAAGPTFLQLEDSQFDKLFVFLALAASQDKELAKLVVRVADQWQKSELSRISPELPDHFSQLDNVSLAAKLGRDAWGKAYPGQALPDRFDEKLVALQAERHRDRNPIESKLYYGSKREAACGEKWKEAVEADYEMVRDRLRKRSSR